VENSDNVSSDLFLTLTLGKAVFAIAIHSVREILDYMEITRIPHSPECMKGVVNVRGSAVPVVDLGLAFGLPPVTHTQNTRIVIVELRRDDRIALAGALADSVQEVLEIPPSSVAPAPVTGRDILRGIARIDERFILLLDVDKVFSQQDIQQLEGMLADAPGVGPVSDEPGRGASQSAAR
jgi:purine-binding chemotaxis protein CheW